MAIKTDAIFCLLKKKYNNRSHQSKILFKREHIASHRACDRFIFNTELDFCRLYILETLSNQVLSDKLCSNIMKSELFLTSDLKEFPIFLYVDISAAVKTAKGVAVEFRVEKAGIIHAGIGKVSFGNKEIEENILAFIDSVVKARPFFAFSTNSSVSCADIF